MKRVLTVITFLGLLCIACPLTMADPCEPNIVEATIDIDPDTLNLKSRGRWITCYIWLPEDHNVEDINAASILLEDVIEAEWKWFEIEDQVLMVKFNRSEVQGMLEPNEAVELTVTGDLADGNEFEGTDTIRVIGPIIPPFAIRRLNVWTHRRLEQDRIRIFGTINLKAGNIAPDANSIRVSIWSADDSNEPVHSEPIAFNPGMVKRDRFRYINWVRRGEPGAITLLSLDMKRYKFLLMARNIGLSGLEYPLTLEIEVGSYHGITDWP